MRYPCYLMLPFWGGGAPPVGGGGPSVTGLPDNTPERDRKIAQEIMGG